MSAAIANFSISISHLVVITSLDRRLAILNLNLTYQVNDTGTGEPDGEEEADDLWHANGDKVVQDAEILEDFGQTE